MRANRNNSDLTHDSLEAGCDRLLLGRLGSELALVYHDTLQAPLPTGLRRLIDRLDTCWRPEDLERSSSQA